MLIDDIKKAKIQAMKDHDENKKNAFSMVVTRYQALLTSGAGKEGGDAEVLAIIQKFAKELEEEKQGYLSVGRSESAAACDAQKAAVEAFLPKQLSEEEIRSIFAGLEDKSMPSVMKFFKANYAGKVDMSLVSKIARGQ